MCMRTIMVLKNVLLLCLFTSGVCAGDLIYLNGFENSALVSGTASGLSSNGLSLELTAPDGQELLLVNDDGNFGFSQPVTVGNIWSVRVNTLPNSPSQQSCILSNYSGSMLTTGANNLTVECDNEKWNWNEMDWGEGGWK